MSDTVTTKAAAEACETTPRLLRQFLRASKDYTAVGSGGRYAFEAGDLPTLKTRFVAWVAEREAAQAAREKAAAEAAKVAATPAEANSDDTADVDADDVEAIEEVDVEPVPVKAKPGPRSRKVAA